MSLHTVSKSRFMASFFKNLLIRSILFNEKLELLFEESH